jgi:uncharacterized membrane protein
MQDVSLGLVGLVFLVFTVFTIRKLAPRDGEPGRSWLQRENVAMVVSLGLVALGVTGLGLIIRALA